MIGELNIIKKFMYEHSCLNITDYGMQLVGPDNLYIYTCIPQKIENKVLKIMGEIGFGILIYQFINQEAIVNVIKESINHSTTIEYGIGTSSKVKRNLALFDKICKNTSHIQKIIPKQKKTYFKGR